MVFAIVLFFGVQYLPESPRWLVTNGRTDEGASPFSFHHRSQSLIPRSHAAQRIIASLEPCAFDDEIARLKTRLIVDSVGKTSKLTIKDCFTSGPTQHRRRTWIGVSSQVMQQVRISFRSLSSPFRFLSSPFRFLFRRIMAWDSTRSMLTLSGVRCRSVDAIASCITLRLFINKISVSIVMPRSYSVVEQCTFLLPPPLSFSIIRRTH